MLIQVSPCAFGHEQSMLVRITGYWRSEGSGERAAWNGARLRAGHCAVDPRKIPYGSKVVFPDIECVAVDTGPAVVSRKSARFCGRNAAQKSALVIDRFFETKREAVAWTSTHPQFITVRVISPDPASKGRITVARQNSKQPATANAASSQTRDGWKASANMTDAMVSSMPPSSLVRAAWRRD